MRTLYIDTHLNDLNIILFEDTNIIKEEHIINERNNSTLLMPSIAKVIDNELFDEILVINGPGSFTGVRLGVTVAKTLAYTMNKKIKAISFLDAMHTNTDKDICAFSDGNGYYIKDFKTDEIMYLKNKEYTEYKENKNIETDVSIDYKKLLDYSKSIDYINPHAVNPIYIKKIGVEENDSKN